MDFSELVIRRVISSNSMHHEAGAGSTRENRPYTGLMLRVEGETEYLFDNKRLLSNLTHPVILPKGSSYRWRCLERGECFYVEIDTDLTAKHPIGFCIQDPERLRALLLRIKLVCLQRAPHWQLCARALCYEALHLLFSADATASPYLPSKTSEKIRPALLYLHTHYQEESTNDTLAALCGLSTVYFRKLFTSATGCSPIRYLQRLRVQKAKELLQGDYGTLAEIAAAVGYADVFHFSKTFKSVTGISPGSFAKKAPKKPL